MAGQSLWEFTKQIKDWVKNNGLVTELPAALAALGVNINLATNYPASNPGKFSLLSQAFTSPDDTVAWGYNIDGKAATEPVVSYRQEINYPVVVRGIAGTRTLEQYREFRSDPNDSRTIRPLFFSFCPASGGSTGFINAGYQTLGTGYLQTPGGGGFVYYNSDQADTPSTAGGWDFDGFKPRNINCMVDDFLDISVATAANPMVVTLSTVSTLLPGANLEFWSVNAAALTNKGFTRIAALAGTDIKIVSIAGNAVTTDYNNTGGTITTAHKCKRPQSLVNSYQGSFQKVGIGRTIPSYGTEVLSVGGPATFYASAFSLNDLSASARSVLTFNKVNTAYQCITATNLSVDIAQGFFSTNTAAYGFGPTQVTDSNFTQAASYLSINANGIGVGGTSAAADGRIRIAAGSATQGQIQFQTQADYTGAVSGACALWFDGTNFKYRIGGTTKTITAA